MKRTSFIYLLLLTLVGLPIFWVLHAGSSLVPPTGTPLVAAKATAVAPATGSAWESMKTGLAENLQSPLGHLFLQLIVIIAASRLMGRLFSRMGQPAVVGEMAAGILLGPSLFGLVAPDAFQLVFPLSSLNTRAFASVDADMLQNRPTSRFLVESRRTTCTQRNTIRLSIAGRRPAASA